MQSVTEDRQRFVAHGLIEHDGTYLVLRRRDGRYLGDQWDIPGGTVDTGETPAEAAVREVGPEIELGGSIELTTYSDKVRISAMSTFVRE